MPGDVHIEWDDAAVKLLASAHNPEIAAVIDRVSAAVVSSMKFLCPVSPVCAESARPSGYLRSSIHAFRLADGDVIVGPTADYAEYVNNDTRPHVIESHGPWPLRSKCPPAVFGRVVHHPGTRGQHFIERSVQGTAGMTFRVG